MILLFLFMVAYVYVLHSKSLDKFYTGSTELEPEQRLAMHLAKYYASSKFISKVNDWAIFHTIKCDDIKQARAIKSHIKRMKSAVYIKNLKKYPEISEKLKSRYQ